MRNQNRKGIKHLSAYTITCAWCGEAKEVTRADARTCSPTCRQRLSRLTLITGFPPDEPPGKRTVQHVYLELVQLLLAREKSRREQHTAYIRATGQLPALR